MRNLLREWPRVRERLRGARSIALFLDFDGTLAPTVSNPAGARMNPAARAALLRLTMNPRIALWIISGRRRADLRGRIRVPGLRYLGVHGGEAPGVTIGKSTTEMLVAARSRLAVRSNGSTGVLVEDKGIALTVHYRNAPGEERSRARRLVGRITEESEGALRFVQGDCSWEILPREIGGKGETVRRIWRSRFPGTLVIYAGNDGTDESAFAALAAGITIRVGPMRPTRARYWLRDTRQVSAFLEKLEQETQWKQRRGFNS